MKKYIYSLLLCAVFALLPATFSNENGGYFLDIKTAKAQEVNVSNGNDAQVVGADDVNEGGFESGCAIKNPRSYLGGCMTPLLVTTSGYVLFAAAGTFDFFLQVTLEPEHLRANYIANTWATMRDLANITFILGIIAVAFLMISGYSGMSWKAVSTRLIIIALLLNFSLFFSQLIIDGGNITASVFWEQIKASGLPNSPYSTLLQGGQEVTFANTVVNTTNTPSPSAAIVGSLNLVQSAPGSPGLLSINTVNALSVKGESQGFLFALNVLIIIITITVGLSLFKTGFMFLTRTIVLTILMIVSPLAFVCYFFPGGQKYWGMWLSHIVAKSFCVVVYLFFIFLLLKILEGTTMGSGTDFANSETQITLLFLFIAVNAGIIFMVLGIANKVASSMCEGGVTAIGTNIMKTTVGAASLAVGGAARSSIGLGGLGRRIIKSEKVGNLATSNYKFVSALGNTLYSGGEKMYGAKFGMDKGYGDKLVEQSKKRADRADALAGVKKKKISAEEKERLITEKTNGLMKTPEVRDLRQKKLDDSGEERIKLINRKKAAGMTHAEAEKSASEDIKAKVEASIQAEMRKKAEVAVTSDQIADATTKRTKEEAKAFLEAGKGSALDWVLAGGVRAYNEAADSYKVFDEGDKRKDREKASLIAEKAKMASAHKLKGNDMDREVDKLANIITEGNLEVMLDSRTISELRKDANSAFDTSALESLIKEAYTTKSKDADGNDISVFDAATYEKTMSGFDADMELMKSKFSEEASLASNNREQAKGELQRIKTEDSKNVDAINAAERNLAASEKEKKQLAEKIEKATSAIGRKTTAVAKDGLKAQLQQATALGTAQYDNAAEESDAAALQAKENDSISTDLGITIKN